MPVKTHDAIINLGIKLGYPIDNLGLCKGVSVAWMSACIVDDETTFKKRISKIVKESPDVLYENIQRIKDKCAQNRNLAAEDIDYLEILAFYESVHLHQSPQDLSNLFSASYWQTNVDEISKFSASQKMESAGGLLTIHSELGIFTQEKLVDFLSAISQAIDSMPSHHSKVGFILEGLMEEGGHAVSLIYDKESHQWKYFDINHGAPKEKNAFQIAEKIHHLYSKNMNEAVFNIGIMTTGNNIRQKEFSKVMSGLNKNFGINENTVNSKRIFDLIFEAARLGHVKVIKELAKYNVDFNIRSQDDISPIILATLFKQFKIVEALAKIKTVQCDAIHQGEIGPAHIAAKFGYAEIIRALALHQSIDFNQECDEGSPAMIAAKEGHISVIEALAEAHVDINKPNAKGETPLYIAGKNGDFKMVQCLLAYLKQKETPVHFLKERLKSMQSENNLINIKKTY